MLETANARAMTAYATHVVTGQAAENHERTDIAQVANDAVALIGSLRACEPQNRGAFIRCGRGAGRSATSLLVVSWEADGSPAKVHGQYPSDRCRCFSTI